MMFGSFYRIIPKFQSDLRTRVQNTHVYQLIIKSSFCQHFIITSSVWLLHTVEYNIQKSKNIFTHIILSVCSQTGKYWFSLKSYSFIQAKRTIWGWLCVILFVHFNDQKVGLGSWLVSDSKRLNKTFKDSWNAKEKKKCHFSKQI